MAIHEAGVTLSANVQEWDGKDEQGTSALSLPIFTGTGTGKFCGMAGPGDSTTRLPAPYYWVGYYTPAGWISTGHQGSCDLPLLSVEGTTCLSEYPRKHTMTRINTIASFDKVAQTHKKRGYYLQSALEEKGITGVIPGATKVWKFNTYGTTRKQAEYLARSFVEIARENGLKGGRPRQATKSRKKAGG